jgi:hypothetical protein
MTEMILMLLRIHISLFGCLLLLDANISYLVQHSSTPSTESRIDSRSAADNLEAAHLGQTRWLISGTLSAVLLCMTAIALLNESVDTSKSLIVNNRYLPLGARGASVIVLLCLPVKRDLNNGIFLATIVGLLQVTVWWELISGLERGTKFIERMEDR